MRHLIGCLFTLAALMGLAPSASAQQAVGVGDNYVPDPTDATMGDPEPDPAVSFTPSSGPPADSNDDVKLAKRRMYLCGAAMGAGAAGVLLAYYVGPNNCANGCNLGRTASIVFSGTVISAGLLGLIPASLQLRNAKRRDRVVRYDLERGRFVF
jgi:hypothetical protein